MALWSNSDVNTSAPKFAVDGGHGVSANGDTLFANTQVGAYESNVGVGTFGVDATEAGITSADGKKVTHAGWVLRRSGTGYVKSVAITAAGTGYPAAGFLTLSAQTGATAANVAFTANASTGAVETVTIRSEGAGYVTAPTAVINNANTSMATFSVVMGGRAGRVEYETLVAMGSMTGDGSDDTLFPDA